MSGLTDYIGLTPAEARRQWRGILDRVRVPSGERQERFCPVETLLCYGLFYILRPNRYGGANMHTAPAEVHVLAMTFRRSAASLLHKMFNLDGSLKNAGKNELALGLYLAEQPDEVYAALYRLVLQAARAEGQGEADVPDFLGLLVDEALPAIEIPDEWLRQAVSEEIGRIKAQGGLPPEATERLALQRVRIGQQRFARQVLGNYEHRCGFCGFAPQQTRRRGLLIASHIKPWRDASNEERMDPRNGIAACPIHDRAFDAGLLVVNGGLCIHRADDLRADMTAERMGDYFGSGVLYERLRVCPEGAPDPAYLEYHRHRARQAQRR